MIENAAADRWKLGEVLYGIPWHVCPTVALYGEALVIEQGRVAARWRIAARERQITV